MNKIKLLIKNTSLNLLGYVYLLLASFISVPMLARGLGEKFFAQYLLLAAIPPLISVFDFGVNQATIRTLSIAEGTKAAKVRSSSYLFFLLNAVLLALVTFAIVSLVGTSAVFAGTQLRTLVLIVLAGSVFLNQITTHFLAIAQSLNRFDIFNVKTFVVGSGNTIVAGIVAARGGDLLSIFLALFISYLLTFLLVIFLLEKGKYIKDKPRFDQETIRSLLSYGLRSFVGTMSGQIELQAGKYTLASLSSLAISAFSIPQMIMYRAAGAISQCALALFPLSSSLSDPLHRDKLRNLYYRLQAGLLVLGLLGVLLAHLIGYQFLLWWLKDASLVNAAFPILKILSYFFVLLSLTPIASTIVDSLGYPQYTSASAAVNAILNTILLLVLTPRYGAIGAAYAILISYLIMAPLFLLVTERVLQSNKLKY